MIFEKSKVWKIFVEMENEFCAEEAKKGLNNQIIFPDDSKMQIYYSNLESISFNNNNSGGLGFY